MRPARSGFALAVLLALTVSACGGASTSGKARSTPSPSPTAAGPRVLKVAATSKACPYLPVSVVAEDLGPTILEGELTTVDVNSYSCSISTTPDDIQVLFVIVTHPDKGYDFTGLKKGRGKPYVAPGLPAKGVYLKTSATGSVELDYIRADTSLTIEVIVDQVSDGVAPGSVAMMRYAIAHLK